MLENELSSVQQGFREIKEIEEKNRNEELHYIDELSKKLLEYLSTYSDA